MKRHKTGADLYIVGVGGSAGALVAFSELLSNIPKNSGLAFVIVQHLLAGSKSNLSEILAGKTELVVKEVSKDTRIEPNHVYVIPSHKNIVLADNELRLSPRKKDGLNLSIDEFLVSLANGKKQNAIGVVLSGTGSDGTRGMQAIREVGGITFVQGKGAAFSAMPESVIAAGLADFILSPSEIAKKLVQIASSAPRNASDEEESDKNSIVSDAETKDFRKILALLLASSDVDFTYYKPGTLKRRITRRMILKNLRSFSEYAEYLQKNPKEVDSLYQDILIKVTHFFRDQSLFDFLQKSILPQLLKQKPASIRVWVPGCATGEEVYSLAITLAAFMDKQKKHIPIQIFGTDISEVALNTARAAKYPQSIETNVPQKFLSKYFIETTNGYEINATIRAMCIFAKHNIVKDVPFTKMDIVSCRNVLIYLDSMLQKKAFPIFHYALKPKGFLLLGTAETATSFQDLFAAADKNQKVYTRKQMPSPVRMDFTAPNPPLPKALKQPEKELMDIGKRADKIVLLRHAPAGIIINDDLAIIQFRGDVSPYLKHAPGRATLDLVKMAHRTLLATLLSMIERARKSGATIRGTHTGLQVNLEVIPLDEPSASEKRFLILFEDAAATRKSRSAAAGKKGRAVRGGIEAEEELSTTIDQLQSVIEARDITNEELRSAHEEVMSANEELQSTNEELETTKEELQSTNEELMTPNAELQNRNAHLKSIETSHQKMVPQFKLRGEELHRKDEFISILGHELRNPLAPIVHMAELARLHGIKDPEVKHMMDVVGRQAKLMSEVIESLLDAARAQSRKIDIKTEPVDFNTLIHHAIETVQPHLEHSTRTIELQLLDSPTRILLDPLRIEQVIVNLLTNAIKYTAPDGKISLSVTREDGMIVLCVKDNGMGISKEMLPKVFDLFSQENQALTDFKGGLGVGLMLAKTIAELHDGSLTVSSEGPDKGSEFVLRLPFNESAETSGAPAGGSIATDVALPKKRIMLVDDNKALADVFGRLLTNLGQEVRVAYDGASALAMVHDFKPEVIFIDIVMPHMSGYDLVQALRKDSSLTETRFIALSGFGKEFIESSKDAGFDDHLTKPVSVVNLQKILSAI
ncbi:MAG: response regulator [Parcubacteria group bacterium]|nr:response regulator [Parcubacteria group bacterium]